MKYLILALALIGAAPAPSPTPIPITSGINITVSNMSDANGSFHCEYVTPAMRVILNLPTRIEWICAR